MTTTEHGRPSRTRVTGTNDLRLYVVALLASTYVAMWWVFATRAPRPAALPDVVAAPSTRPAVPLPPGWQTAERSARPPSSLTAPIPIRRVPARPGRIRTRSS